MSIRNNKLCTWEILNFPSTFWVQSALLLWMVLLIPGEKLSLRLMAFALGGVWVFWRCTQWKCLLILGLAGALAIAPAAGQKDSFLPEKGEYRITQIRAGYAVASSDQGSVLVYKPESLFLDQRVELSKFEVIHTLNNPEVFSFQKSMEERKIRYSAALCQPVTSKPESLQGKIWVWIGGLPGSDLYRLLFYGISREEQLAWIGSLGLGLIALCRTLQSILSRFVYRKTAGWIVLGVQALLLILFPTRPSMIRLLVFTLPRQLKSDWKSRWPLSVILFLLILPDQAGAMTFVLPAGISFFSHFAAGSTAKKLVSLLWCAFCQMLYMNQVSLLFLCFFTSMRTLFGWLCLLGLPGLFLPSWSQFLWTSLQKVPFSSELLTIHGLPPFWYAALLFLGLFWMLWKQKRSRTAMVLALFCLYPWIWKCDPFFHLVQLDVGQGDAAVLIEPFGRRTLMIDAAGTFNRDNASELFIPFFKAHQVDQLDALIVTHSDFDHSGSMDSMCAQFPVRQVVTKSDQRVESGCHLRLLLPDRSADPDNVNDSSLISHFEYDGFRYLMTGDASIAIESQLIEQYALDVDILKLGHHGSNTSSAPEFLKETSPQLALISCGFQNRYGHPSIEVLQELNRQGIDRIDTASHGQIHLASLPGLLFFSGADGLWGWIQR